MKRNFFSSLDNDLLAARDESIDSSSCSQTKKDLSRLDENSYIPQLLNTLNKEISSNSSANLVCIDGQVISLPLPLLCLAWPGLAGIVKETICCGSSVAISVPGSGATVLHVKKIILHGCSSSLSNTDQFAVLSFLRDVGLDLNIESESSGQMLSENDVETLIIEESSDEDNQEDHIEHFWETSSLSRSIPRVNLCSSLCRNDCHKLPQSWKDDDIQHVKTMFSGEKLLTKKNKLISHLEAQGNIGVPTDSYVIKSHEFCLKFMSFLTGISEYILRTVLQDYQQGIRHYEHGNKGIIKQQSFATLGFICWFKQFLSLYGQSAPDDHLTILSYWLKGKVLYNIYVEEVPKPRIALTTFYKHLVTYFGPHRIDQTFPCVRISKYSSHSVCDICVALNTNQKLCKTEAELSLVKGLRNQHKLDFGMARKTVENIKQSALNFPSDNLFIQVDGMDNRKSYCPRYMENSKEQAGTERLPTKISGCIIWSGFYEEKRKILFFLNHDHFGKCSYTNLHV